MWGASAPSPMTICWLSSGPSRRALTPASVRHWRAAVRSSVSSRPPASLEPSPHPDRTTSASRGGARKRFTAGRRGAISAEGAGVAPALAQLEIDRLAGVRLADQALVVPGRGGPAPGGAAGPGGGGPGGGEGP